MLFDAWRAATALWVQARAAAFSGAAAGLSFAVPTLVRHDGEKNCADPGSAAATSQVTRLIASKSW
jgi:hypothetical protein